MAPNISASELRTYEELYEHQGARIRFDCDHVTYEGIIDMILPSSQQVRLKHTKVVGKEIYFGMLRFRFSDIPSFSVVESVESVNRYPRNEYLLNILKDNTKNQSDSVSKVLYGDQLSGESDDEDIHEEEKKEEFILHMPSEFINRLPNDSTIIDILHGDFDLAVRHITKQPVIGVSFDGPLVSRFGNLTWVCISTTVCVFLFDIQKLGYKAFDNGLRNIFESKSIKKVIHDCRFASDCLAHQYSTQLTNVFDTQIADFVVHFQRYNDKYEFTKTVSTLECCLRNYLKVPSQFLYQRENYPSSVDKETFYSKRPISNAFQYDLMRNALYLILLQEALAKELLAPLSKNVDAYQRVLAKASKTEYDNLGSELSPPDTIPPGLLMHGIQTACFRKPQKMDPISLECKFIDPRTGSVIEFKKTSHSEDAVIKPSDSKSASKSKISSVFDKENHSKISKISNQNKGHLENAQRYPSHLEEDSSKGIEIFVKPSLRQIDELYHKLANKVCSDQSENIINIKPSECYVSKFSIRKPFSDCSTTSNLDPSGKDTTYKTLHSEGSEKNSSDTKQEYSDSSEIWDKIRADIAAGSRSTASQSYKDRKIQFVPA